MMTIKEFASLCECNAQTLRYYDRIDLLKPIKVDRDSGYRYYESTQAVDFVKIKNLQLADFTIGEIKDLLVMTEQQVIDAFEQKIAEQTQKLERIMEIQRSYLNEVNTMKKLINSFCDDLKARANDAALMEEFGLDAEGAARLVETIRGTMLGETVGTGGEARQVKLVMDETCFEGAEAIEKMNFLISEEELDKTVYLNATHVRETAELTENMERVWEFSGWRYTHEVLERLPEMQEGERYAFVARIHGKDHLVNLTYPLFFIGALIQRGYDASTDLHGYVESSTDGQNHFELMRKV